MPRTICIRRCSFAASTNDKSWVLSPISATATTAADTSSACSSGEAIHRRVGHRVDARQRQRPQTPRLRHLDHVGVELVVEERPHERRLAEEHAEEVARRQLAYL